MLKECAIVIKNYFNEYNPLQVQLGFNQIRRQFQGAQCQDKISHQSCKIHTEKNTKTKVELDCKTARVGFV